MPAHRHPKYTRGAGKVPTSRLPLGTPAVGADNKQLAAAHLTARSASSQSSHPDNTSDVENSAPSGGHQGATATTAMSDSAEFSLADAKLRRQQERAQRLEALMQPNLGDKAPRGKVKNPDKAPEPIRHPGRDIGSSSDGGVSIEVRINKYTVASRDTSLSRSMSSVSQQTAGTGGFDMERHDSVHHDNAGFQMYSRQRGARRPPAEQSAFPEQAEKPKTVEANYDEHEVLDVFKKRLPGLDYLTTSPGQADGEVQFVQHPNGDVSAHMWSMRGYEWCNIGSFSNIRKKVEGQLAGDRLKGETAWQKLQQNTLTYFRVLAKQREAGVMGYSFGQEDIKQALPEPRKVQTQPSDTSTKKTEEYHVSSSESTSAPHSANVIAQASRADRPAFPHIMQPQAKSDDPFSGSSAATPFQSFGSRSSTFGMMGTMGTLSAVPPGFASSGQSASGSPFLSVKPYATINYGQYSSIGSDKSSGINTQRTGTSSFQATAKPYLPARVAGTADMDMEPKNSYFDPSTPTSHSRSPRSREMRLGHLREIQENAMKRSQSQTNLTRTVLNDPLHATEDGEYDDEPMSPEFSYYAESEVYDNLPRDPKADFEEMCKGWTDTQPRIDVVDRKTSALTLGSVPDIDYHQPPSKNTHMSPQELRDSDRKAQKEGRDKDLQEWWTSGHKFARQEELFRHLMATSNTQLSTPSSAARRTTFGTPSAQPRPIGAPAITSTPPSLLRNVATPSKAKDTTPQYNKQVTRILIPVYENLASYVQGPADKRRDYWCRWVQPPEWCIDRGEKGNRSFFDSIHHKPPPERVGRDPRYRAFPGELKFGGFSPQQSAGGVGAIGSPAGYSSGISGLGGFGGMGAGGMYGFGGGRY